MPNLANFTLFGLLVASIFMLTTKATVTVETTVDNETVASETNVTGLVDVESSFTVNGTQWISTGNSTVSAPVPKITIGSWTIIRCGSNEELWVCELQRRLIIPQLNSFDTLHFVVFGDKLKVGCATDQTVTRTPAPKREGKFHLRIWVDCPKRCSNRDCPSDGLYLPSYWFGLVAGVLTGITAVGLLAACVNTVAEKDESKNDARE